MNSKREIKKEESRKKNLKRAPYHKGILNTTYTIIIETARGSLNPSL
jgi:hypothetical protein